MTTLETSARKMRRFGRSLRRPASRPTVVKAAVRRDVPFSAQEAYLDMAARMRTGEVHLQTHSRVSTETRAWFVMYQNYMADHLEKIARGLV